MSVKTYKQYKEKAIFDISSDEIKSYETKIYSSIDSAKLFDASLYKSFQDTIDNVAGNFLRFDFTDPANGADLTNKGTSGSTLDATLYTVNVVEERGRQTVGQYIWPHSSLIGGDFIDLYSTSINNLDTSGFTISFWAEAKNITNKNYIFYAGLINQTLDYTQAFISILFPWGGNSIYFICGDGSTVLNLTNGVESADLIQGELAHWSFVRKNNSATEMTLEIYKNGILSASSGLITRHNFTTAGTKNIYINSCDNTTTDTLKNALIYLEDFRIYNRPLSASEILKVYSRKPPVNSYIYDSVTNIMYLVKDVPYIHSTVQDYVKSVPVSNGYSLDVLSPDGYLYTDMGQGYRYFNIGLDPNINNLLRVNDYVYKITDVSISATTPPTHTQAALSYDNGSIEYSFLATPTQWAQNTSIAANTYTYVNNHVYQVQTSPPQTTISEPSHTSGIYRSRDSYSYLYAGEVVQYGTEVLQNIKYIHNNGYVYEIVKTPINLNAGLVYPNELPPVPTQSNSNNLYVSPTNRNTFNSFLNDKSTVYIWKKGLKYSKTALVLHNNIVYRCLKGSIDETIEEPNEKPERQRQDKYVYAIETQAVELKAGIYVSNNVAYWIKDKPTDQIVYLFKIIAYSIGLATVEPNFTGGITSTGSDGITYKHITSVTQWAANATFTDGQYVAFSNKAVYVVERSSGQPATEDLGGTNVPSQGTIVKTNDGYEYKFVAVYLDYKNDNDGVYKDDFYLTTANELYQVTEDPCVSTDPPDSQVVGSQDTRKDGYDYIVIDQAQLWAVGSQYQLNDYIMSQVNPSYYGVTQMVINKLYKIVQISVNTVTRPSSMTINGVEDTQDGYMYRYLGSYKAFAAGMSVNELDLVINANNLYQITNVIISIQTAPNGKTTQTLDNGITYQYYGNLLDVTCYDNYMYYIDMPYGLTQNAKVGIANLSFNYDTHDVASDNDFETDRFEIYSQTIMPKNMSYSKNAINRGTPLYRLFFDGSNKTSVNIHNDLYNNSIDVRDTQSWLRAGGTLQLSVRMPLSEKQIEWVRS